MRFFIIFAISFFLYQLYCINKTIENMHKTCLQYLIQLDSNCTQKFRDNKLDHRAFSIFIETNNKEHDEIIQDIQKLRKK
jgi:hypothetical protein